MQKKLSLKWIYLQPRHQWLLAALRGALSQGHLDYDDAIRAFHELVEQDLRRLTVPTSTSGAEEVLGRFVTELKASGHYQEEDIQIHTKFVPDKDVLPVINMEYTEGIVDRSLKRMHREAGSGSVPLVGF